MRLPWKKKREERRGQRRARCDASVEVFTWGRHTSEHLVDLGEHGAFVECDEPLPEGRFVTLRMQVPGTQRAFTVLARVVRSMGSGFTDSGRRGMAVRFFDLVGRNRRMVEAYVAAHG